MAQKKFSRLSILLEARDRMTQPIQNATRASQRLQGAVNSLSGQLNRSASANDRMRQSVNNVRTSTVRMSQSIARATKDSALAHVAGKLLSSTYTVLTHVVEGSSIAFAKMKVALAAAIRNSKAFQFTVGTVEKLKNSVQDLNTKILGVVKSTKMWQNSSRFIKTMVNDVKIINNLVGMTANKWKDATKSAIQNSKVLKTIKAATQGVRNTVASTVISFTLWKNSSVFVSKLKNDLNNVKLGINAIGRGVLNIIPGFRNLQRNIQNINHSLNRTQGRRATFNQLADSNARLNRELAKMNAQLSRGNSQLSRMRSSIGHLNGLGAAFGVAYAGQAAYGAGERAVTSTVGKAMEQQYSSASVGILAGEENGAKYYEQIAKFAASTTYSTEDWARNMRSAISKSKTVEELEKFQIVMEQLATLDPIQGLDGAALAVRELNSGDSVSLQERFELPKSALKEIRKITDPIKQIEALSVMIGKETGYTVENLKKMKELPLMQWQKLTNSVKTMFGYIGSGALEVLAPQIEKLNEAWDQGKFKPFIKAASEGFANITKNVIDFATKMQKSWGKGDLKQKLQPFLDLVGNIKDTVVEAWPTISNIFNNVRGVFAQIATDINNNWPTVNTVIQKVLKVIEDITAEINDNWPAIKEVIIGVTAAFAAFKILSGITIGFKALTGAIALWRSGTLLATAAQWALNGAMLANPIGLIIGAIAGLIGFAVWLGRNIDMVTQKFEGWGNWKHIIMFLLGPLGWITESVIYLNKWLGLSKDGGVEAFGKIKDAIKDTWDMFMKFVDQVKNTKIDWKAILPGGKGFVDFGGDNGDKGHKGGLNHVPYDGYKARLHKGERVLTAQENKDYGKTGSLLITGNTFNVRQESDIDAIAQALFKKLESAKTAMG